MNDQLKIVFTREGFCTGRYSVETLEGKALRHLLFMEESDSEGNDIVGQFEDAPGEWITGAFHAGELRLVRKDKHTLWVVVKETPEFYESSLHRNAADAEKLKADTATKDLYATLTTVEVPDKGEVP